MRRPGMYGRVVPRPTPGAAGSFILLLFLLSSSTVSAQTIPWDYSVGLRGTYVTTSRIYRYPDATLSDLRSEYVPIDKIFGFGAEVRVPVQRAGFFFSLNVEYLARSEERTGLLVDSTQSVLLSAPEEEGVRCIPIEFGINAYIPIGTERLRLTMGGGAGLYYTVRTYRIAGVATEPTGFPVTGGIYVDLGLEYRLWERLAVRGSAKFRDPEVTSESTYGQRTIVYKGRTVQFPQTPVRTKVNVDGMVLSLLLMWEW